MCFIRLLLMYACASTSVVTAMGTHTACGTRESESQTLLTIREKGSAFANSVLRDRRELWQQSIDAPTTI